MNRAIVATDDQRIVDAVRAAGLEAVITRADHASGTDRLAEVAAELDDVDILVNVQGDEPLIAPEPLTRRLRRCWPIRCARLRQRGNPSSAAADVLNPDLVKVVVDENDRAVYFSRAPVPYPRDAVRRHGTIDAALRMIASLLNHFRKHTGLYVYRRDVLLAFAPGRSPHSNERSRWNSCARSRTV